MGIEQLAENFEVLVEAPGGIDRLREMIIALAVSGRVASTEIFERDSATDLLESAAKEIHPYPEMSEPRFEIPNHWVWVPLASIAFHQLGKMLNTGKMKGQRVRYLRSVNIRQDGRIDLTDLKEMLIPIDELAKYDVKLNDIFVNEGGDVGRNAIWTVETEESFAFQNQLHRLRPVCGISGRYLQLVLRDAKSRGVIAGMSSGVTIQHFSASSIRKFAIPLPPIAEQKRIVAQSDELMALCDQLEERKNQRENIRTAARESAINAISTAQTPEELDAAWKRVNNNWKVIADTPASIESIRKLINNLAVRGLLSKTDIDEKPIDVPGSEGPYELPPNWKWTRIQDVSNFVNGYAFPSGDYKETGIGIVRMSDLKFGQISVRDMKKVSMEYFASLDQNLRVIPGDLVIGMSGSIGKPCFNRTDQTFLLNQRVGKFSSNCVDKSYLAIVLRTLETSFVEMSAGSGIKNLSTKQIKDSLFPLPPRAEQERIAAKVEDLTQLCERLEVELKVRSEVAEKFARSVLDGG